MRRRAENLAVDDPSELVDTLIAAIDTPRGRRPVRVVSHRSLGDAIGAINAAQAQAMRAVLEGYGSEFTGNEPD